MKNTKALRFSIIVALGGMLLIPLIVLIDSPQIGEFQTIDLIRLAVDETPVLWLFLGLVLVAFAFVMWESRQLALMIKRGRFFSSLFKASPIAIVSLDTDHMIVTANPSFEKLFGYAEKEIVGKELDALITSGDAAQSAAALTKGALSGQTVSSTDKRLRKDGSLVDVEISGVPVLVRGELVGVLGLYQDVSEREAARRELRKSEENYRDIYENTIDFLYAHDLDGKITGANPAFIRASGHDQDTLFSMTIEDMMPEEHKRFFPYYLSKVKKKGQSDGLLHVANRAGEELIIEYKNSLIMDEEGPIGIRGSARDITSRIELEEQLKASLQELDTLARTDSLTGLFNRRGIYEHLAAERQRAQRLQVPLSVAMIDLDRLKYINDNYGHTIGDEALRAVTSSILKCIRSYDRVGRHGGDEFLVVLPGATLEQTRKVCSRIAETVRTTKTSQEGLTFTASIGFTSFKEVEDQKQAKEDIDEVLTRADDALYLAKESGGDSVAFYDIKQGEVSKVS